MGVILILLQITVFILKFHTVITNPLSITLYFAYTVFNSNKYFLKKHSHKRNCQQSMARSHRISSNGSCHGVRLLGIFSFFFCSRVLFVHRRWVTIGRTQRRSSVRKENENDTNAGIEKLPVAICSTGDVRPER